MPQQHTVTKITIFAASPGDVEDERSRLEQVVLDLNNASRSRAINVEFDLVKWETHAYPGFASYPQAVINEQVPQDYDIFIGIMVFSGYGNTQCVLGYYRGIRIGEETLRFQSRFDSHNVLFQRRPSRVIVGYQST